MKTPFFARAPEGALRLRWSVWIACALALVSGACRSDPTHTPPPPPLPVGPPTTPPTPIPEPTSALPAPASSAGSESPSGETADKHGKSKGAKETGHSLYDLAKRGEATLPTAPVAAPTPAASKPATPAPAAPSVPPPAPAPAPTASKGKVTIPRTAHVQVDVSAGLQAALDLDPRMQPWTNKVIQVIDTCYTQERTSNANAAGVIGVRVTMHSESRPDADIKALPPALSGVVACATGGLMRTKMPLFTGQEGERHDVSIRFVQ